MKRPLISVITVSYNAVVTIEQTIKSILSQSLKDIEYIIIDGGSSDGTKDIITRYQNNITYWISEPDRGIYDAMNKGIIASKGRYIYFIGADDTLYNAEVLEKVARILSTQKLDILVGETVYDNGTIFKSQFNLKMLLHNTIHHQAAFYKRQLFEFFIYDIKYKLIADYELNLKLYLQKNKLKYKFIPDSISVCKDGGASRLQLNQAFNETNAIRRKVLGNSYGYLKWIYAVKFYITKHAF